MTSIMPKQGQSQGMHGLCGILSTVGLQHPCDVQLVAFQLSQCSPTRLANVCVLACL